VTANDNATTEEQTNGGNSRHGDKRWKRDVRERQKKGLMREGAERGGVCERERERKGESQ
jgi:hypothetical protein